MTPRLQGTKKDIKTNQKQVLLSTLFISSKDCKSSSPTCVGTCTVKRMIMHNLFASHTNTNKHFSREKDFFLTIIILHRFYHLFSLLNVFVGT